MKHTTSSIKKITVLFVLSAFCYAGHVSSVSAQTVLPLTVGPARQQIALNPGEEAQVTVKFYNQSDAPLSGFVKTADFLVDDDMGTPRLIENTAQASPKFSASSWIVLPYDRMTMPANDKTVVQATIKAPANARPGGRYVAIYFEPISPFTTQVGESGSGIVPRVASLLYIRVNGPITENAFISNMFAKSFYEYGPIEVTAQIANNGDYHIRPQGSFTLTNLLGGVLQQSTLKEQNIFPDAVRVFTATVGEKWMMGQYKITLNALYGEKNQAMQRSINVWVFPWRVASVLLLALIILGVIARIVYKNIIVKEASLEDELSAEKREIEKLKKELEKKE